MKSHIILGLVVLLTLAACTTTQETPQESTQQVETTQEETQQQASPTEEQSPGEPLWRTATFTDVQSGETFSIADFEGETIVLETFAVWCPTCLKQQQEIQKLIDQGDDSVHISLDIDPNEDENRVRGHAERHGFEWYFAISEPDVSKSLIDEFGSTIASAPSAPVVIIKPDGTAKLLKRGLKSASTLQQEIA